MLPWLLVGFRLLLGPLLLLAAFLGISASWLAFGLVAGIFSDILDGIIARRLRIASQQLRRVDSLVDTIFVLCVLTAVWILFASALEAHLILIALMLGLNLTSYIPALIKFGKVPAYHAYSAKAAGLALFASATWLFLTGQAGWWLDAAILLTMLSHVDRIAITLLLPEWRTDVAGIWAISSRTQSSK